MNRDRTLSRLSDGKLVRELEYTRRQCLEARKRLAAAENALVMYEQHLPLSRLQLEYQDHLSWLETIVFEINFRRIP